MSQQQPHDDVLLHESDIVVTSARIIKGDASYTVKFISQVTVQEYYPPMFFARFALVASLFAMVVLVIYWVVGKVEGTGFIVLMILSLLGVGIAACILYLSKSEHSLRFTMVNGQESTISCKSSDQLARLHEAVAAAVSNNRQDTAHSPMMHVNIASNDAVEFG